MVTYYTGTHSRKLEMFSHKSFVVFECRKCTAKLTWQRRQRQWRRRRWWQYGSHTNRLKKIQEKNVVAIGCVCVCVLLCPFQTWTTRAFSTFFLLSFIYYLFIIHLFEKNRNISVHLVLVAQSRRSNKFVLLFCFVLYVVFFFSFAPCIWWTK